MISFWSFSIASADIFSALNSSGSKAILTTWLTPFRPRTQGSDRNVSCVKPTCPCEIEKLQEHNEIKMLNKIQ